METNVHQILAHPFLNHHHLASNAHILGAFNLAIGLVDFGILHVILLAFSCWLLAMSSAYYIFRLLLSQMGMPALHEIINHFKLLNLWEQYLIYVACYALLLCSAIGALIAIC